MTIIEALIATFLLMAIVIVAVIYIYTTAMIIIKSYKRKQ